MFLTALVFAALGISALFIAGWRFGTSEDKFARRRALGLGVAGAITMGMAMSAAYQFGLSRGSSVHPASYHEHIS